MSLDVAHSLADIFDLDRGLMDQNRGNPVEVKDNLYIQEIDIQEEIQRHWSEIHKYISSLLNTTGMDEVLAEELAVFPGMEEVSLLLYINQYVRNNQFDVILLDCAPTGESIRFISIPTTLEWYMKKIFKMERLFTKYVGPVARRVVDFPLPDDDYFNAIEELFNQLKGVDQVLMDPEITTVRLVSNPEKVVLKETQRAFMYFCLYKMNIDAVIMNRILPDKITDDYFTNWMQGQKHHLQHAHDFFSPIPIFAVNLFDGEVIGYDNLKRLADQIYGRQNPLERFYREKPYRLDKVNGHYRLRLKLPFITKKDVELNKSVDQLIVRIGSQKRHILLPRHVAAHNVTSAKLDNHYLNIIFEGEDHDRQSQSKRSL
jgi:arsenite-transporting ATPase